MICAMSNTSPPWPPRAYERVPLPRKSLRQRLIEVRWRAVTAGVIAGVGLGAVGLWNDVDERWLTAGELERIAEETATELDVPDGIGVVGTGVSTRVTGEYGRASTVTALRMNERPPHVVFHGGSSGDRSFTAELELTNGGETRVCVTLRRPTDGQVELERQAGGCG